MAKVRVPVYGAPIKSVLIDPDIGAAVAALQARVAALEPSSSGGGSGGSLSHHALSDLQDGDDHPQYTMWQAAERITAPWSFVRPILGGSGSAALPEFAFFEDPTSGVFLHGTGGLGLAAGGDLKLSLDALESRFFTDLAIGGTTETPFFFSLDGELLLYGDPGAPGQVLSAGAPTTGNQVAWIDAVLDITAGDGISVLDTDAQHPTVAVDEAFAFQWTGIHTFLLSEGRMRFSESDQGDNERLWDWHWQNKRFELRALNDALVGHVAMYVERGAGNAISALAFGHAADNPTFSFLGTGGVSLTSDNQRLQIGAGADLLLYHDGTNSRIDNATGDLIVTLNAASGAMRLQSTDTLLSIEDTDAAPDEKIYWLRSSAGLFRLQTRTDAAGAGADVILVDRTGTTVDSITFGSLVRLNADNRELQLGASDDLRLFHDGTNSKIANATGQLNFSSPATFTFDRPVRLQGYTVATLPAGTQGDTAYVTDALAPAFLAIIVGGGAVVTPVFYNGANWVAD